MTMVLAPDEAIDQLIDLCHTLSGFGPADEILHEIMDGLLQHLPFDVIVQSLNKEHINEMRAEFDRRKPL